MNKAFIYDSIIVRPALPIVTMLVVPTAQATVFNVDTTEDLPDDGYAVTACHTRYGNCSLRAAIMKANQFRGSSTIYVPAGTYTLTIPPSGVDGDANGDLNIVATSLLRRPQTIAVIGAGAGSTIIDAQQIDRVLTVSPTGKATITGVTIRGGSVPNTSWYGGGIYNRGNLSITQCVIENNVAGDGGGVFSDGTLTISDSVVENNRNDDFRGGGISSRGLLNVVRSSVRSNLGGTGGGIFASGNTIVRDSTISSNGSLGVGGGITIVGFGAPGVYVILSVVNSTISSNYANGSGGGIAAIGTTMARLFNTTVVGNDADHGRDENGGNGGGVYADYGSQFVARSSLIADNTQRDAPINDDCFGTLFVDGWNLLGDVGGCAFTGDGYYGVGLLSPNSLGPLHDNGGPTLTHALLPGSNAIDATYSELCFDETYTILTTDQRGEPRGLGRYCDIGAFESNDQ